MLFNAFIGLRIILNIQPQKNIMIDICIQKNPAASMSSGIACINCMNPIE
jgi:hypothetical protein